jgi:hypothetical protein
MPHRAMPRHTWPHRHTAPVCTNAAAVPPQLLYSFRAHVYSPQGFSSKAAYQQVHGSDMFITDVDKYDAVCKVGAGQRR